MQLRRIAALERQRIEESTRRSCSASPIWRILLAHPEKIRGIIKEDILWLHDKFGGAAYDHRFDASGDFTEEDLITQDNVLISYAGSYIKRISADTFRAQGRGGRGSRGTTMRQEDEVISLSGGVPWTISCSSPTRAVYSSRVYELPEGGRNARRSHRQR